MNTGFSAPITFDSNVFSVETIKKAAYRYLDRFATNITINGAQIVCELTFPSSANDDSVRSAIADFQKEVLDQDLRQIVATETSAYRNAILALAFSSTKLTANE